MSKAKILFVDDEPHVTQGLRRTLRHEPWEIFTANSAVEAMEILAQQDIDIVVSDERMPGVPGSVFLGKVREAYPETVRIILSGQANLEDVVRAINQGEIYRFCMKPINAADLGITIRQALQQKELLVQSRRLLREYQKCRTRLDDIERTSPGITHLETDHDGAILLDDSDDSDIDELLREIAATISISR